MIKAYISAGYYRFIFLVQTDRAAMLDEIVDYVKFLRLQVKVWLCRSSSLWSRNSHSWNRANKN